MTFRTHPVDVVVIGAGGAGLRAVIAAQQAGRDALVLSQRSRSDAHNVLAAGGIDAAIGSVDPEDSWEQHFADTVREGYRLGDPRVVETVVGEAPAAVGELVEWGCPLARTDDGRLDQRFFGAHRWRRTCYAGDRTGRAIVTTLIANTRAQDLELVQYHPTGMVTPEEAAGTLVTEAVRGEGGRLYNANGERFMARYDRDRMELSTRDPVALPTTPRSSRAGAAPTAASSSTSPTGARPSSSSGCCGSTAAWSAPRPAWPPTSNGSAEFVPPSATSTYVRRPRGGATWPRRSTCGLAWRWPTPPCRRPGLGPRRGAATAGPITPASTPWRSTSAPGWPPPATGCRSSRPFPSPFPRSHPSWSRGSSGPWDAALAGRLLE